MCRILFCDWPTENDQHNRGTFFELKNLASYDIVFFDPLNFSIANDFRQNENDLWVTEYTALSERKFMKLLATVKNSVEQLRAFINNGGIWVIRSNFPNSQIKVLKKSSIGNQIKYTESLTSIFFWLADFINKHSFHYGIDHSIRYLITNNEIYREFKDIPLKCLQTHNLAPRDNVLTIADNGAYGHQPAITKVTYPPSQGELYLIPYFLTPEETDKLIHVFKAIWHEKKYGPFRPEWLVSIEKKIDEINPYSVQLAELDEEINRLEQNRHSLEKRQERIQLLADMLYKENEELKEAISKAMRIIGFQALSPPSHLSDLGFDFYWRDDSGTELVCLTGASNDQALSLEVYEDLVSKMDKCQRGNKPKPLLIANAPFEVPPSRRPAAFCDEMIHRNIAHEVCLMSTTALFDAACLVLENWEHSQIRSIKESIRSDIIECSGLYETNMRRYLAAATI